MVAPYAHSVRRHAVLGASSGDIETIWNLIASASHVFGFAASDFWARELAAQRFVYEVTIGIRGTKQP